MLWKPIALTVAAVLAVIIAEPTPLEQLAITLAAILICGVIFHYLTIWRVKKILEKPDDDRTDSKSKA